jgi:aryl-alcohol dehydrogenase-like predicted oxidoreductase
MHDLIVQGKVLYWGTSEWSAAELEEAYAVCARLGLHAPTMEQPQYNLLHRTKVEKEFAPLYRKQGLGTTIWSPLASGLLTGKYHKGIPAGSRLQVEGLEWLKDRMVGDAAAKKLAAVEQLSALANELGTSLPRLGVAWCLKNEYVSTVILGASKVEQLQENLGAIDVLDKLTPDVLKRIDKISQPVAE